MFFCFHNDILHLIMVIIYNLEYSLIVTIVEGLCMFVLLDFQDYLLQFLLTSDVDKLQFLGWRFKNGP